ncbi:MAG TPA: Fic family protein [Euzebya sp.]|nr:Fic family protein [Euzebya sp.]
MQFTYSHHLVGLVSRVEAAATRVAAADPDRRAALVTPARREAAVLSARLDGSPLTEATVARVDGGAVPHLEHHSEADMGVGWARALKLDRMETQQVAAVEYANLRGLPAVEDELAGTCLAEPLEVLRRLHGLICQGLVDPEVIGAWRRTEQAVHDGGQGMVIYNALPPERVAASMDQLADWIRRRTLVLPPVVTVGVVHQRLLEIHPFEAGNGRVARAFARLVSRALALDPHGVAVPERQLWADATGYYAEVAATMRRSGDLSLWLERHTGAMARALEAAADDLDPRPVPALPERGGPVVAELAPGRTTNLREYAKDAGVDLRTARQDLAAYARAGHLVEVPGGGGLVFQRPPILRSEG